MGAGGRLQQTTTWYRIVEAAENPVSSVDSILESAVSEVTQEKPRVTTLALLKKVAFNPSTLMGHTYVTNTVDERTGKILFIGDLADACSACGASGMLPGRWGS